MTEAAPRGFGDAEEVPLVTSGKASGRDGLVALVLRGGDKWIWG